MLDYITHILPLQKQGVDNATIASHLAGVTARPMLSKASRFILENTGAVLLDPVADNQRIGSLISYYSGLSDGPSKQLIAWFISRVFSGESVETDKYPHSLQFASVEAALPADLKSVATELVESAGGRPFADIVESDVTGAEQQYRDNLRQDLLDRGVPESEVDEVIQQILGLA